MKPSATKTGPAKPKKTKAGARKSADTSPRVPRRAVFVDVENTSSEANLQRVLEHLKIDRTAQPTELTAVGNWRSVGARVARMLAGLGAHLVHSAPAVGVRDWSDLWIAVAAGRWLATAAPGDALDLVSDDRAFDAVGDAAAAAGVVFRRISYRAIPASAQPAAAEESGASSSRRTTRGRRRRGGAAQAAHDVSIAADETTATPTPSAADEEAHAASHAQIHAALTKLSGGTTRWMLLDTLANELKAEGFVRPPGSPRLVTRLRRMKDVEVSPSGMVRLVGESAAAEEATVPVAARPRRRRRRRRSAGGKPAASGAATDAGTSA